MRQPVKILIVFFLVTLSFRAASAVETLPKLPDDPAISKGTLPDGITYYLVANPSVKGVADIAILQRACQNEISFPTKLLTRRGIGPGKEGYVRHFEGNTLYQFRNCPVAEGDTCLDSLLFLSLGIIGDAAKLGEPAYGTTNQTIIVAGDIDRNAVLTKLKMMSMGVPLQTGVKPQTDYVWNPGERSTVEVIEGDGPLSTLRYEYRIPAMDRATGGTAVAVMSHQLNRIFETVLMASVERAIRQKGIDCRDLSFKVLRSDAHEGDDTFYITAVVDRKDLASAASVIPQLFNEIRSRGISIAEYEWAYSSVVSEDWISAHRPVTDAEYVDRCVRAVLYGADLATGMAKVELYRKKVVADTSRVRTFNRYAQGLINEGSSKIIIENAPAGFTAADAFGEPGVRASLVKCSYADTLSFPGLQKKKAKAPRVVTDVMTGGSLWTYSNGLNILYKKMPTDGILYYSWVLRGGEEKAPAIAGEKVGHMTGEDFLTLLAANGIRMEIKAASKAIYIEGTSEASGIQLLFKAFQFLFANRPELGSPMAGQLVLIGDRTEFSIQKSIQNLVTGFDENAKPRARTTSDLAWTLDREDPSIVYQAMLNCDEPLSSENVMKSCVSARLLEEALVEALDGSGYYAEVKSGFVISPRDLLNVHIIVRRVDGMEAVPAFRVKTLVKGAVAGLAARNCPNGRVTVAKKLLAGSVEKEQKTPQYWLEMARYRFSDAKDFVSKYSDKIGKTTPEAVRDLFKRLYANGFVEYTSER